MPHGVPVLNAQDVVRTFERLGWRVVRQRGSHIIVVRENHRATLSIPNHRPVARGTLRSLIRASGVSVDEFLAAVS